MSTVNLYLFLTAESQHCVKTDELFVYPVQIGDKQFLKSPVQVRFFIVDIFAYADIFISMKATAQIFKALSDETRLRIMSLLVRGQELCVCDIIAALDLPQSTVSRHLSYLRNTGLVYDRRKGIWMYYKINSDRLGHAAEIFDLLSAMLFKQDQAVSDQQRLKEHLATKEKSTCE
jgi:ArsR family transcriptional regulator